MALGLAACSTSAAKEVPAGGTMASSAMASSASNARTLSPGARVEATLQDSITSRSNKIGDGRRAVVSANVSDAAGNVIIPAGSTVTLSIAELETGSDHTNAQGKLRLEVTAVTINDRTYPVSADLETVPHHMQGRGITGADAARIGGGTVIGAVAGQVIGKNTKSTVIGGAVGAVAGTAVAIHYAVRDVVVSPGTPIVFTLTQSLNVSAK